MSLPSHRPVFLERAAYRRRRLKDAAKLLPIMTALAILVPVWLAPAAISGALGITCMFLLWFGIIAASAVLSFRLSRKPPGEGPRDDV